MGTWYVGVSTMTTDGDSGELETPIKISWTGKARRKIHGRNKDFDSEDSDRVDAVLSRESTNAVIESVAEAKALADEMTRYADAAGSGGRVWVNGAIASACQRVRSEVVAGLRANGYDVDASGLGISVSEPPEGRMTTEDVVQRARDVIESHGAATIRDRGMEWTVSSPEDVEDAGEFVRLDGGALDPSEHTEVEPAGGGA